MIAKRLPALRGVFEILGKIEEAFQKPGLLVEPVIGQDRLVGASAGCPPGTSAAAAAIIRCRRDKIMVIRRI